MATPKPTTFTQLEFALEDWRDIPGWEGQYQASTLGRIRSLTRPAVHNLWGTQTRRGVLIRGGNRRGYRRVTLQALGEGKRRTAPVHVLILETFIGPRPPGYVANHKDYNKDNNAIGNLEWVTPKRNSQHAHEKHVGHPRGERNAQARLTRRKVLLIRGLAEEGMHLPEIAALFQVTKSTIWKIIHRKAWTHVQDE